MLKRATAITAAFVLGWVIYMIGMVLTVYDGLLSLILQPFLAAVTSASVVAVALLLGTFLRIPTIFRWWTAKPLWATVVAGASLFVLACGYFLGLTYVGTNPNTGREVVILHPVAAIAGYFFVLFAVANWPTTMRSSSQ